MKINSTTPMIRVKDNMYPVYLYDLRKDFPYSMFSDEMESDIVKPFGYEPVIQTARPDGDVVTELPPVKDAKGVWNQKWEARAFTSDELLERLNGEKVTVLTQAKNRFDSELRVGFPMEFTVAGKVSTYHVQAMPTDRMNLHGLKALAEKRIAEKDVSPFKLRVYENIFVTLTPEEVVAMYYKVMSAYESAYTHYWEFKDLIDAANTKEELTPVPDTFLPSPAVTPAK